MARFFRYRLPQDAISQQLQHYCLVVLFHEYWYVTGPEVQLATKVLLQRCVDLQFYSRFDSGDGCVGSRVPTPFSVVCRLPPSVHYNHCSHLHQQLKSHTSVLMDLAHQHIYRIVAHS